MDGRKLTFNERKGVIIVFCISGRLPGLLYMLGGAGCRGRV